MTRFIRRAMMAALFVSAASTPVVTALEPADAAPARGQAARNSPTTTARPSIGIPINDALKLVQMMDFAGALAKVQLADKQEKKTPYEEFTVAKYLGVIALGQPMRDMALATIAYNRMIASGAAPDAEKADMYELAMKLNFQAGDMQKVVLDAAELQKIRPLDEVGYQVLTQTYFQANDFPNAITTAKKAIDVSIAAGQRPNKNTLGMLLNAQAKTQDPGYRQTLDQLAMVSDQAEVWGQVMDFALATQNITDHQLLNVFRLALRVGTMRDVDYPAMATIDLTNGLSIEGKTVLDKAIMAGTIMRTGAVASLLTQANGLVAGEQKSLPDLASEAAKQSTGEIYTKLAESYWANGKINEAVDAMQKGIAKGGLKDMADAQTTLGIIYMDAGKSAEAIDAFQKAEAAGGTGANIAHAWSLFSRRAV
jgi:tetratricopeptide (TPR) repeat protein